MHTRESKHNVEACCPDDRSKPALPPIQKHQHQTCAPRTIHIHHQHAQRKTCASLEAERQQHQKKQGTCTGRAWTAAKDPSPLGFTSSNAPVTTGEMLKGRSSMLMTKVFPQNSLRVSCMAATMPNTVFTGTATSASNIVNFA